MESYRKSALKMTFGFLRDAVGNVRLRHVEAVLDAKAFDSDALLHGLLTKLRAENATSLEELDVAWANWPQTATRRCLCVA